MTQLLGKLFTADEGLLASWGDIVVEGLTADSRAVQPGYIFAALPGVKVDGSKFLTEAKRKGAVAALVSEDTADVDGLLLLRSANPRRMLALAASRFYGAQPDTIVAVTGTNGKTSVTVFVRQIWAEMGFRAASLGTIGIVGPNGTVNLSHTTPDPVQLHAALSNLKREDVEHLAVEASSHGLDQFRLDGMRISAGAFTNFTQDHLDYHGTFEAYFSAKMRLFEDLLQPGAVAVVNADIPEAEEILRRVKDRGLLAYTVGHKGKDLRILSALQNESGQVLRLAMVDGEYDVPLPLVGDFQASNAVVAAGLVLASGGEPSLVRHALASLKGATGRLELTGKTATGARVYVDYAHTPDAVETALKALRPSVSGKLYVVFGCGGDRDRGKRPLMAKAAATFADAVYVTDDNPRTEDAAMIRQEIMVGAPRAVEIADRAEAISQAVQILGPGDVLLIAGKGHEQGQIVGNVTKPFNDHDAVSAAIAGKIYHAT
jgi:UDP-N-acetylmuramoyl-L-alanyl-D-glutamate--2,6-diaminopimelate ligase